MAHSNLANRFTDDASHLVWRSDIHRFSSDEVLKCFNCLRERYCSIVDDAERPELDKEIEQWSKTVTKVSEDHRHYSDSGIPVC